MTLEQMQTQLRMCKIPHEFYEIYPQIQDLWQSHSQNILSESFLSQVLDGNYALIPWHDLVIAAAGEVRKNEAMCLLICLLEQWVKAGGDPYDADYQPPIGEGLAYDFLHIFPALPSIPDSIAYLRNRNVPEDVIVATMQEYDYCIKVCITHMGRPAFDRGRLGWISLLVRNTLIRIGRFKYDLPDKYFYGSRIYRHKDGRLCILADNIAVHRSGRLLGCVGHTDTEGSFFAKLEQTEDSVTGHLVRGDRVLRETVTLPLSQWELLLCGNDPVPRIHIPDDGSFDAQTIADSFQRARHIFAACYPDLPFKAFFCSSWLMSVDLRDMLKPSSNILGFQNCFLRIPFISSGLGVFSFAFNRAPVIPESFDDLPENTSLQKSIKQHFLSGGYIHEGAGIFF